MHPKAEAFLNELRAAPKFQTAPASDPVWLEHVDEIEFVFRRLYEEGAERTEAIAILDDVLAIISRKGDSLKTRLLKLAELLAEEKPTIDAWGRK
jgi:hypothetical protein